MHNEEEFVMNPYISIICPCYNGAALIECAISSILLQPIECIELLIIDDGSMDNTFTVCNQFTDYRIRYFKTENFGTGHARNFGLEQARGTWIMYLDADDLYLCGALNEVFINFLSEYEQQGVDIVYTPCSYSDLLLSQWIKTENAEDKIDIIPKHTFWNGIYNHNFLVNNGIRFYEYKEQDVESAFRYLTYNTAGKTVTNNNMKFYLQRENFWGNTHTWDSGTVSEIKTLVYYDLFKNHAHSVENHKWLLNELLNSITNYYISVDKNGFCNKNKYSLVCKIAKECLFTKEALTVLGIKKHIKEILRYLRGILFAKERVETTQNKINERCNDVSSDLIIKRLRIVSSFLLN